ncbi:DsbA family oxidoreductase [Streptomyces sp. NPDC086010]|uniref:DsbA family oxidoreductase n=1 Tax=Streptomyces sp. NPDC086010 TaxID=3365745 RepID=UPI0037CD975F
MRVEMWTDIACPWCYVGREHFNKGLADFAHRDQVEVVHRSFELNPKAQNGTVPIIDAVAAQYGRTHQQQVDREHQAASMANAVGLEFRVGGRVFGNTFDLHRLSHFAKTRGLQGEFLDRAFQANFAEERSVYDTETVVALAVEVGLEESEVREVLADPKKFADDVRSDERRASEIGVSGVPFFVLGGRYGVNGVQAPAAFTRALEQAWADQSAA